MKEREEEFVVEEGYLDQSSVSSDMRAVLVDWLLQVRSAWFCSLFLTYANRCSII